MGPHFMLLLLIYVLYSNVTYIYPVSCLVEIKLFQIVSNWCGNLIFELGSAELSISCHLLFNLEKIVIIDSSLGAIILHLIIWVVILQRWNYIFLFFALLHVCTQHYVHTTVGSGTSACMHTALCTHNRW